MESRAQIIITILLFGSSLLFAETYYLSASSGCEAHKQWVASDYAFNFEREVNLIFIESSGNPGSLYLAHKFDCYVNLLNELSVAMLTAPHLEPIVIMATQLVANTENQFIIAQTTKESDIFLIFITQAPNSVVDLEFAVNNNLGVVTRIIEANINIQISTYLLDEGFYFAYAFDIDGRISEKGSNSITVENFLLLNHTENPFLEPQVYYSNYQIKINLVQQQFSTAKFELYDLSGRFIQSEKLFQRENSV